MKLFELILEADKNRYLVFIPGSSVYFEGKTSLMISGRSGRYKVKIKKLDLSSAYARIIAFRGPEGAIDIEDLYLN